MLNYELLNINRLPLFTAVPELVKYNVVFSVIRRCLYLRVANLYTFNGMNANIQRFVTARFPLEALQYL